MADNRSQTRTVITWVGWHMPELVGVLVPTALAASVSRWFAVPAGLVAAAWTAHEIRVNRRLRPDTEPQSAPEQANPTERAEESAS